MKGMFQKCSKLNNLDVKNFKTNNVTDMSGMFNNCSNLITQMLVALILKK